MTPFLKVGEQYVNLATVTYIETESVKYKDSGNFTVIRLEFIAGTTLNVLLKTKEAEKVMSKINISKKEAESK